MTIPPKWGEGGSGRIRAGSGRCPVWAGSGPAKVWAESPVVSLTSVRPYSNLRGSRRAGFGGESESGFLLGGPLWLRVYPLGGSWAHGGAVRLDSL